MGNGRSIQIRRDPDPNTDPNRPDSVSISRSQTCEYTAGSGQREQCRVNIDQSISTSSITLSRTTTPGLFSDDTKLVLTPSLPFRVYANGASERITKMTLYHPCPLRVENVQYDAVLTLNDSSDAGAQVVILVPIVASSNSSPSAVLMDRVGPRIAELLSKDPNTNAYPSVDISTGADWALSSLIPTNGTRIQSGFFQWISGRGYESYTERPDAWTIVQRWKPREPRQGYILLDTPIQVSAATLAMIMALPRTDPLKALPPVSPVVTYVPCANTPAPTPPVRENFDPECDPFGPNAYKETTNPNQLMEKAVQTIFTVIAVMIGVYVGLLFAGSQASIYTKEFGETAGGWIYKQIQSAKDATSSLKGSLLETVASQALKR